MKTTPENIKHKTVGISMHPNLESRGKVRADTLGLRWSAYVCLCVEAELKGFSQIIRDESLDLENALERARSYQEKKTLSINFELDVEAILQDLTLSFERFAQIGSYRTDFLIEVDPEQKVAVECRFNIQSNYALALGQTILLRSLPDVSKVVLVVPYLKAFDPVMQGQFATHDIVLTTPDVLEATLRNL